MKELCADTVNDLHVVSVLESGSTIRGTSIVQSFSKEKSCSNGCTLWERFQTS